jgi:hypothetical protein
MLETFGYSHEVKVTDERHPLWAKQREERGFDDTELWSLDLTIARFLLPRLKALRELSPSVSEEEIDRMIAAFEEILSEDHMIGVQTPQIRDGLAAFADNFQKLWN